ncbi:30S ribosomal protein S20 [Deferribacter autotrophicus]|uniref:Small ribosomal subunit protein bS20 n=1 Tax=Deferribacter autotrophicus TaxID=500465 RepID=A0A5A8F351_9BACT|nr:30S ribosomal protein S20 [Deferribacter autotrophicus]KAA0257961.1 30S ribosomal protein S20 [Deferribacter autotrophicus]
MAHTLSAKKRIRQNERRRLRNKSYKSMMKTFTKKFLTAVESGNFEEAEKRFNEVVKVIYKVQSKGVIHKNQAARRVSRLAKRLQALKNSVA